MTTNYSQVKHDKNWALAQIEKYEAHSHQSLARTRINFRVSTQTWELLSTHLEHISQHKDLSTLLKSASPSLVAGEMVPPDPLTNGIFKSIFTKKTQAKPVARVRDGHTRHPDLIHFEQSHHVRFYGSQVRKLRTHWRCLNACQTASVQAETLEELVALAPHIIRPLPAPPKKPKKPTYPPVTYTPRVKPANTKGRPTVIQDYESQHNVKISGFNVRLAKGQWTCLSPDKRETLTYTSLSTLLEACPYVVQST